MSLYKAWSSNRTYASSLWGKKGQAAALPQFYNKWNRERERQQGQACHTLSYPHPWVPDGREGKGASSLSQDHEPFNRVGNWFCCLAFWSNYLQLAKFSHRMASEYFAHPFTWPLNSQSILMESFWLTFLFRLWQNFPQLCTPWYAPKR